jgi:hypothetical protein
VSFWVVVQPVGLRAVQVCCVDVNRLWELVLKTRENVIEAQGVRRQMHPP